MSEQESGEHPQEPSAPRRPWTTPSLEVIPAADAEASSLGPDTDGITGIS
jgi:hypothetical protein